MPFQVQEDRPNCGAYALAYYTWLMQGHTPAAPPPVAQINNEPELVDDIYNLIQFENLFDNNDYAYILGVAPHAVPAAVQQDFPLYSNPADIVLLLHHALVPGIPNRPNATFHVGPDPAVRRLFDQINARVPDDDDTRLIVDNVLLAPLPIPGEGEYAIALFSVAGMQGILGIHYVLIRGTDGENYEAINSWDGDFTPVVNNTFVSQGNQLTFLGAGITL